MLLGFEYVGVTSSNLDQSLEFYCGLLGLKKVLVNPTSDGGRIAFLDFCGVMLEIIGPPAPVQTPAREAPLSEAGIRHITFRVDDVEMEFGRLQAAGVVFTSTARPKGPKWHRIRTLH